MCRRVCMHRVVGASLQVFQTALMHATALLNEARCEVLSKGGRMGLGTSGGRVGWARRVGGSGGRVGGRVVCRGVRGAGWVGPCVGAEREERGGHGGGVCGFA